MARTERTKDWLRQQGRHPTLDGHGNTSATEQKIQYKVNSTELAILSSVRETIGHNTRLTATGMCIARTESSQSVILMYVPATIGHDTRTTTTAGPLANWRQLDSHGRSKGIHTAARRQSVIARRLVDSVANNARTNILTLTLLILIWLKNRYVHVKWFGIVRGMDSLNFERRSILLALSYLC